MRTSLFDVVIIGAGAAGLFCAGQAGQRGLKLLLIDHAEAVAEKIRISGGGRCNFTNRDLDPAAPHKHFVGQNPQFCRSALSRYTPADFIALVQKHAIPFHEKHKGQLFCDRSAEDLIAMLLAECEAGGVERWQPCSVKKVAFLASEADGTGAGSYQIDTDRGPVRARSVVVATGGLSIPKIGATDFGHRLAQQFGVPLVERRPGLVPLTFDGEAWAPWAQLAGLALPVQISTGTKKARMAFDEDLLFTHRGLSGPVILQVSSYWQARDYGGDDGGSQITINLFPAQDVRQWLAEHARSKALLGNLLAERLPRRFAHAWCDARNWNRPTNQFNGKELDAIATALAGWQISPDGTLGYAKAEVTLGGVDTRSLSSKTMEARDVPGLFFIGEVMDVTGHLGGYNFQWAWASGHAAGTALAA